MKKAYLSIASLLACITLAACNPTVIASSDNSTPSSENTAASSVADVFTYTLELETPSVTTYEVGDIFDFASVGVKEQTFKNGSKDGNAKTLARNEFVVKVNGQVIEGNFTFSAEGEVEFVISSAAHSEATASFKLTAVKHYSITNGSADKVVLTSLPEKALAGETVSFGVTLLPGFYLESGVKVLNDAGEEIETHDNGDFTYSFTMPAGNVTITINTGITDFTISKDQELIGDVIVEGSEDTSDTFSAIPGTKLKFQATETVDTSFSAIYVDGVVVEKGEDDFYHFTMPHHPVVISAEKTPREYAITSNASELTVSTMKMYVDLETKQEITTAHKGQTVYIEFSYDVVLVKYEISVKDADGNSIEVAHEEGTNIYSFAMISSNISINIKESDYSKYYGYYLTNKAWKFTSYGNYSASAGTLNYSDLKNSITFESNGTGTWTQEGYYGSMDSYAFTWNQESDGTSGKANGVLQSSYTPEKNFYYTEHLILTNPGLYSTSSWQSIAVGTWDSETTIHALALGDSKTRLFYTLDNDDNIVESVVVESGNVYINPSIYKDDSKSTLAKGADISLTSSFYISTSAEEGFGINKGELVKPYDLKVSQASSDQVSVTFKDAEGKVIAKAKNGDTVTLSLALSEDAAANGLVIETPTIYIADSSYQTVAVTPVEGEENTYTFVMPSDYIQVKAITYNPNLYAGYSALGKYVGFELYQGKLSGQFSKEIAKSGKFLGSSELRAGDITGLTNTSRGKFMVSGDKDQSRYNKEWSFGDGVIATLWSTNINDSYVAVRVPEDFDSNVLTTKLHWIDSGKSWALEFYISDSLAGSIFATNNTFYCGATFEMTGSSTSIGTDATYTVKLDGQAIFNVANETVTVAE